MSTPLIRYRDATFRKYRHTVFHNTSWELRKGEHWVITGANGSGKTTFLETIAGQLLRIQGTAEYGIDAASIASVWFGDKSVHYGDFYYQQRYHAAETEGIITVRRFLALENNRHPHLQALNITPLLDMEIIKLSNGQFKKMLIAKALLKNPRLLLLDNPFTGLDAAARTYVAETMERIAGMGTQVVMTADGTHVPRMITHVMEIERFSVARIHAREETVRRNIPAATKELPKLPEPPAQPFETVVRMDNVTVRYNEKTVIDRVDWHIRKGEKWALTGSNGAGKSMLLSLIFADHPQAYANRITLFDCKRGSGESIWDIKERTGFVSPEMHMYYGGTGTCTDLVLGGLTENPYNRRHISVQDTEFACRLFAYFSVEETANEPFRQVSTGQRNVALLMRALVKNPALLILDEPFQGLDEEKIALARTLLDAYCNHRTLIFVSHNPSEFPSCIQRCLTVENGKATDTNNKIFTRL
ncbi:MAG: ATP-binding cassette domain-containing protein [Bacteroidales bacterium]|jgi:molybdate transport system ATP-binding protein|nr:ATP-binding cassette domain-containing protein [Bacteroidales bacterium]